MATTNEYDDATEVANRLLYGGQEFTADVLERVARGAYWPGGPTPLVTCAAELRKHLERDSGG